MENSKKLTEFEREYYSEIKRYDVTDKDLTFVKVPPKVLAYEVYLRKVFGDSFAKGDTVDDYDDGVKRSVEKLSRETLDNSEFSNIMNDIQSSEFDDNMDIFVKTSSVDDISYE